MVIASIDLKNGHVVQLKNGKELVLQRDDADSLISQFSMYGEVAIIDLDAALGNVDAKGNTVNTPLLKSLLHRGDVRTGGGIRSVKRTYFIRCTKSYNRFCCLECKSRRNWKLFKRRISF